MKLYTNFWISIRRTYKQNLKSNLLYNQQNIYLKTSDSYLQIKRIPMGTIFAPTYSNLTMGYHEIKVYCIICQSYALLGKHYENFLFRILEKCQILQKLYLLKLYHFLSVINQINNNNIQFTIKQSQIRLNFLDAIKIWNLGVKMWMKSGCSFKKNQQTQKDLFHLPQTTHDIVSKI